MGKRSRAHLLGVGLLLVAVALSASFLGLLMVASLSQGGPAGGTTSTSIGVSGTIQQGVEAGCVILQADDGSVYLLLGSSSYPSAGTRVTVTGYVESGVASYCMQGTGFHVISIATAVTSQTQTTSSQATQTGSGSSSAGTASTACALYKAQFGVSYCPFLSFLTDVNFAGQPNFFWVIVLLASSMLILSLSMLVGFLKGSWP